MDFKSLDYSKLVSPLPLSSLLSGFEVEDDSFLEEYPNFDVNSEEDVRNLIRIERPASDYAESNKCNRFYFRSFCYFLTTDILDFGQFFDKCTYLPFRKPENSRQFYIWMFEEIFPGASWKMDKAEEFTITTNQLIFFLACSDDPLNDIDDPYFKRQISSFDFDIKYKFKL